MFHASGVMRVSDLFGCLISLTFVGFSTKLHLFTILAAGLGQEFVPSNKHRTYARLRDFCKEPWETRSCEAILSVDNLKKSTLWRFVETNLIGTLCLDTFYFSLLIFRNMLC